MLLAVVTVSVSKKTFPRFYGRQLVLVHLEIYAYLFGMSFDAKFERQFFATKDRIFFSIFDLIILRQFQLGSKILRIEIN